VPGAIAGVVVVDEGLADALASEIARMATIATSTAISATPKPFFETAVPPNVLLASMAAS